MLDANSTEGQNPILSQINENINVIPHANIIPQHESHGTSEENIHNVVESAAETVLDSQGMQ